MVAVDDALRERRREVALWASYLAFEDRPPEEIQLLRGDVYDRIINRLEMRAPGLVFVTGSQGVGKTCALVTAFVLANVKKFKVDFFKFGSDHERRRFDRCIESGFPELVFVDLPDYPTSGAREMRRDLGLVDQAYNSRWLRDRSTFVVAVQRELYGGHYLFGKGVRFEVPRVGSRDLVGLYRSRFGDLRPFTEESLGLVADASRGVFRRFFRYLGMCVEGTRDGCDVNPGDVSRLLTLDVISDDMGLELSSFLRGDERQRAVLLLESLRVEGERNQKEAAGRLGLTEASLSRLAAKLEGRGYIRRVRGERKELILQLTPIEYLNKAQY